MCGFFVFIFVIVFIFRCDESLALFQCLLFHRCVLWSSFIDKCSDDEIQRSKYEIPTVNFWYCCFFSTVQICGNWIENSWNNFLVTKTEKPNFFLRVPIRCMLLIISYILKRNCCVCVGEIRTEHMLRGKKQDQMHAMRMVSNKSMSDWMNEWNVFRFDLQIPINF